MIKDKFGHDFFKYFTSNVINSYQFFWFLIYARWIQVFSFIFIDWKRHINDTQKPPLMEYWEDVDFWTSLNMDYSKLVGIITK